MANQQFKPLSKADFVTFVRQRNFFFPSFEIYGQGVAGLYDLGGLGTGLKHNILSVWRRHFVTEEGIHELDSPCLTPEDVLKASGHVDKFTDVCCQGEQSGKYYRADHLIEAICETEIAKRIQTITKGGHNDLLEQEIKELESWKNDADNMELKTIDRVIRRLVEVYKVKHRPDPSYPEDVSFKEAIEMNLMFASSIGAYSSSTRCFLRPELAQGIFVNFARYYATNGEKMPLAIAQIGQAFRNEIAPKNQLLRVREFTLAEIEHFQDANPDGTPITTHDKYDSIKNVEVTWLPEYLDKKQGILNENLDMYTMTVEKAMSDEKHMEEDRIVQCPLISNQTHAYFIARTLQFLLRIGIDGRRLRFRQHRTHEMAHYANCCWDAEINCSAGWIECVGLADRACYDLTCHSKGSGKEDFGRVRKLLEKPVDIESIVIKCNKAIAGRTFRKDIKKVETYFLQLTENEQQDLYVKTSGSDVHVVDVEIEGKPYSVHFSCNLANKAAHFHINVVKKTQHDFQFIPQVIEPSFGIGRILYCVLEHAYEPRSDDPEETMINMKLKPEVAPIQVGVISVSGSANQMGQDQKRHVREIDHMLRRREIRTKMDVSSVQIGRKYVRQDSDGVPFCVTVDNETLKDEFEGKPLEIRRVTLRERDSKWQVRLAIKELPHVLTWLCTGRKNGEEYSWYNVHPRDLNDPNTVIDGTEPYEIVSRVETESD